MMRLLTQFLIVGALCWLGFVIFGEMKTQWDIPADSEEYNPTTLVTYFLIMVVMAIAIGVVVSLTILPAMGDVVGKAIFNPNQKIEKDPHADALGAVARGEYGEAVEEYKSIVGKNPGDMHAISEVARLQCEKLEDYDAAANYLHDFLEEERPSDETAFLAERLVDVYWNYQQNHELALPILRQLVETMAGTNHAANAFHRIRDIEDALGQEHELAHDDTLTASESNEDDANAEDASEVTEDSAEADAVEGDGDGDGDEEVSKPD